MDDDWYVHDAGNRPPTPLRQLLSGKGEDGANFGWWYCVDFGGFTTNSGVSKKGLSHFVRRRKLTRTMVFNGEWMSTNQPTEASIL